MRTHRDRARTPTWLASALCAAFAALTWGCNGNTTVDANGNANGSGNVNDNASTNDNAPANENTNDNGAVEDNTNDNAGVADVSFAQDVQPIFTSRCSVCHRAGGSAEASGIALQLTEGASYDLLVNQPSSQDASLTLVVPGDPGASLLVQKIESDSPPVGVRMPRSGTPLSDAEIELIRTWVAQGAQNN